MLLLKKEKKTSVNEALTNAKNVEEMLQLIS